MTIQTIYWWITAWAKKLGLWGFLGLSLLIGSAVIYWVKLPAIQAQINVAEQNQLSLDEARADKVRQEAMDPAKQAAKTAKTFYQRFSSLEEVPALLRHLDQLAKKEGIVLEVGDYRYQKTKNRQSDSAQRLTQYKMIFPIEGRYPEIRRFVDAALVSHPELALSDLQIVRESREQSLVSARIVFVAYVKDAS